MSSRGFPREYKNSLKKKEVWELSSRELPCKLSPGYDIFILNFSIVSQTYGSSYLYGVAELQCRKPRNTVGPNNH